MGERDFPNNGRIVSCLLVNSKWTNNHFDIAYSKYGVQFQNDHYFQSRQAEMKQNVHSCAQQRLGASSGHASQAQGSGPVPASFPVPTQAHAANPFAQTSLGFQP